MNDISIESNVVVPIKISLAKAKLSLFFKKICTQIFLRNSERVGK